jgi:beta-lactamase class C
MARFIAQLSAMKAIKILIAAAALMLAGGYGYHAITGSADDGLPDTADEWEGRVDYARLDRELTALSQRPEMAGLAVAVVEDGELRFVGTYGVADRATGARVTPNTIFRWASLSKTVAGTLAASMAEQKQLDLARPINSWPNSLRLPGGAEARITLGQLLSHQTGLTKNAYDEKLEDGEAPDALRARLSAAPLQCFPGTCHTYQNIAFDAASAILADAAKAPYPDAATARLFRPLGMSSASFGMAGLTGAKDWARPYDLEGLLPLRETYWRVPAAAGVNSNIVDLAKWLQATMGERPKQLPRAALKLAQSPRVETPPLYGGELSDALSDQHYGLGWRSFAYSQHRLIGHSGSVSGYRATMIFEPATRTGVVAMWNSDWGRPFRIPFAVFDSYHGRKGTGRLDLSNVSLPQDEKP